MASRLALIQSLTGHEEVFPLLLVELHEVFSLLMKCAVLLRVFSLPNQSKAFRKDTVFFLLPPFSMGCAKMVGFPYAHKSRAFELKHGAASRNTLSGSLGLSISRVDQSPFLPVRELVLLM
jgi:hypothetical protein